MPEKSYVLRTGYQQRAYPAVRAVMRVRDSLDLPGVCRETDELQTNTTLTAFRDICANQSKHVNRMSGGSLDQG